MADATLDAAFGGNLLAILAKLVTLIKSGAITALTNESTIVAMLEAAGITITPTEEAEIALLAKTLLAYLVPTPVVKTAAPLSRVDVLTRALLLHVDAFGGAKDTALLTNLRAIRTFHGIHQLIADAGGTTAIASVTSSATPIELSEAETAAKVVAGTTTVLPTTINWANILTIVTQIMAALAALKI
jgi:hypothetical protein